MFRVVVALLMMVFAPQVLAQETSPGSGFRLAQHGNVDQADTAQAGHALDQKHPVADGEESAGGQCAWRHLSELPGFLACQSGLAGLFQNIARALALLAIVLAFAVLLLWFYLRRAANAAELTAKYIPTAERAYVFGGPTDLAISIGEASVRLAMQNCGKTPAMLSEWSVEFMTKEPRSRTPAYDLTKRTLTTEVLEPNRVFSPPAVYRSEVPSTFFIVGYIKYKDVFQKEHVTRFCVGVSPEGKAAAGGHEAWNLYD
jgi:hypothetical protein